MPYPPHPSVYRPWPPPRAGWWYAVTTAGSGRMILCGLLPYPDPPAAPAFTPPPDIVAHARAILDTHAGEAP